MNAAVFSCRLVRATGAIRDPMFPTRELPAAIEGFDVIERLGFGAAGEVFLARSPGGQLVAIKTIPLGDDEGSTGPREEAGDAGSPPSDRPANAFVREASVCARLRHPCIVQVRALLGGGSVPALVFEYVPGVTLARVLRRSDARGVRLPDKVAWHIVDRVLQALAYAHAFRDEVGQPTPIVHRDVSPANVLLDWSGGVKIADFGIAKVIGVSPATRFGLVKGTPGCMAPEQARGDAVDERADVYAAALLAWRLSTGRPPFGRHLADEFELLRAMRNPRIKPLDVIRPDLSPSLLAAVARALEPEPERRSITAAELGDAVRSAIELEGGEAELGELLARWKGALEGAVKRATESESDLGRLRQDHTLRYEEVALAFDEETPPDAPTFEGHALPSEPWPAALPQEREEDETESSSAPLQALPPLAPPPHDPSTRPHPPGHDESARARPPPRFATVWAPVLALAGFAAVGLLAGILATCAR